VTRLSTSPSQVYYRINTHSHAGRGVSSSGVHPESPVRGADLSADPGAGEAHGRERPAAARRGVAFGARSRGRAPRESADHFEGLELGGSRGAAGAQSRQADDGGGCSAWRRARPVVAEQATGTDRSARRPDRAGRAATATRRGGARESPASQVGGNG